MGIISEWNLFSDCKPIQNERVLVKFKDQKEDLSTISIFYWQDKFLLDEKIKFIQWRRF